LPSFALQQQQGAGDFSAASHCCKKANLMNADAEADAKQVVAASNKATAQYTNESIHPRAYESLLYTIWMFF
jgi:hypothetical protein